MGLRWFVVFTIFFEVAPEASAGEQSAVFHRYYVAKYSASAAESWARSKGATEAEKRPGAASRECLCGLRRPLRTERNFTQSELLFDRCIGASRLCLDLY
jgi:hypothetical protein